MTIQVNSDKTIAVDTGLKQFVKGEVMRVLGVFATRLTRVEVHLSDVDSRNRTGPGDKRCLVEARPAGADPQSASANARELDSAISGALHKMRRLLTSSFGREKRRVKVPARVWTAEKAAAQQTPVAAKKKAAPKKAAQPAVARKKVGPKKAVAKKATKPKAAKKKASPAKLSARGPQKKRIYQARRKSWPARKG